MRYGRIRIRKSPHDWGSQCLCFICSILWYEFFFFLGWQLSIVNEEGTVAIQNACAGTIVLSDVLYVPKVTKNLISVGQLCDDKQCSVKLKADSCIVKDLQTKEVIGRGRRHGRLFSLAMTSTDAKTDKYSSNWTLWHRRRRSCIVWLLS